MRKKPEPIEISIVEGGDWQPFIRAVDWRGLGYEKRPNQVHAIRFSDGSIWDCANGWRVKVRP